MLLDSKNIYYVESVGILVYFPELESILFYEQKNIDKDFYFNSDRITLSEDEIGRIIFEYKQKADTRGFVRKAKGTVRGVKNLSIYSIYSTNEFVKYFTEERLKTPLSRKGKIDYLLISKQSKKFLHVSAIEPRILRIDWDNELIRYYGEEEKKQNEHIVMFGKPIIPKPISNFKLNINFKSIKLPTDFTIEMVEKFKLQIQENNGVDLDKIGIDLESDEIFHKYLVSVGIIRTADDITKLLDCLDSSILKEDWIKYCNDNFLNDILTNLIHKDEGQAIQTILNEQITMSTQDMETRYYTYTSKNEESKKVEKINISHITVKLGSKLKKINFKATPNIIDSCGAGNCFIIDVSEGRNTYGIRFSQNIYLMGTTYFYNNLIEMVSNCILWYITEQLNLRFSKKKIASIQKVVRVGFYKVQFSSPLESGNSRVVPQLVGYIPYIITENTTNTQSIVNIIKNLTIGNISSNIHAESEGSSGNNLAVSNYKIKINEFILNLLLQIYNFYVINYSYIKFIHGDFATRNIVMDTDTNQIYLIDFDTVRYSFNYGNKRYNLIMRDTLYDLKKSDPSELSETYKWYFNSINKKQNSTDQDIETLLWWLTNIISEYNITSEKGKIFNEVLSSLLSPSSISQYSSKEIKPQPPSTSIIKTFLCAELVLNKITVFPDLLVMRLYELYKLINKKLPPNSLIVKFNNNINSYANTNMAPYSFLLDVSNDMYSKDSVLKITSQAGGKHKKKHRLITKKTRKVPKKHSNHSIKIKH